MKKILLCLMFVLLLSGCGKDVNTNNEKVLEDKKDINITQKEDTVGDTGLNVRIDNFYYKDNSSTVNLIVKNNNDYDVYIGEYSVMVYDKDNKLLGVYTLNMNTTIKSGEETNQMLVLMKIIVMLQGLNMCLMIRRECKSTFSFIVI